MVTITMEEWFTLNLALANPSKKSLKKVSKKVDTHYLIHYFYIINLKERDMTKENLIAQLEGAKALTSVVSIDNVIALIQSIEPVVIVEKDFKLTPDFAEEIANRIERSLDYNSRDLIDVDSAEFELTYDNRIELNSVDVNMREIMDHVTASLERFVEEPEEAEVETDDVVELERNEDDEEAEDEEVIDGDPEE
jgi:hypothetical protein